MFPEMMPQGRSGTKTGQFGYLLHRYLAVLQQFATAFEPGLQQPARRSHTGCGLKPA